MATPGESLDQLEQIAFHYPENDQKTLLQRILQALVVACRFLQSGGSGGGGGGDVTVVNASGSPVPVYAPAGGLVEETPALGNVQTGNSTVAAGASSVAIVVSADFAGTIAGGTVDPNLTRTISFQARAGGKLAAIAITRSAGSYVVSKVA